MDKSLIRSVRADSKGRNLGGRPTSFDPKRLKEIENYCKLGATDAQLAEFLGVCEATINNWKRDHKGFLESIREAKKEADSTVETALFRRAVGYDLDTFHISTYKGKVTLTPVKRHFPPEVQAILYWLNNRDRENWKNRQDNTLASIDGTKIVPAQLVVNFVKPDEAD